MKLGFVLFNCIVLVRFCCYLSACYLFNFLAVSFLLTICLIIVTYFGYSFWAYSCYVFVHFFLVGIHFFLFCSLHPSRIILLVFSVLESYGCYSFWYVHYYTIYFFVFFVSAHCFGYIFLNWSHHCPLYLEFAFNDHIFVFLYYPYVILFFYTRVFLPGISNMLPIFSSIILTSFSMLFIKLMHLYFSGIFRSLLLNIGSNSFFFHFIDLFHMLLNIFELY